MLEVEDSCVMMSSRAPLGSGTCSIGDAKTNEKWCGKKSTSVLLYDLVGSCVF